MYENIYNTICNSYNNNMYRECYRNYYRLSASEERMMSMFVDALDGTRMSVLDIGCGDGSTFDTYLVNSGCSILGMDVSSKQIQRAREAIPSQNFVCMDFLQSNIDSFHHSAFSGIICMYTLFHFMQEDQKVALQKMYDNLFQDGVCLINVRREVCESIRYDANWCGSPMYWSLPGVLQTLLWATEVGFKCSIYEDECNKDYVFLWLEK